MIRYNVKESDIRDRIQKLKPKWFEQTKKIIDELKKSSASSKFKPKWSEIKSIYIEIQHSKCAFCEKRLEEPPYGNVEQDVEHFRPKSAVKPWKCPAKLRNIPITNTNDTTGYPTLAYHPLNYVIACKTCNTILKKNFFPILGKKSKESDDIKKINQTEKPYLIYPIGTIDNDPEDLIKFHGLSPQAKRTDDKYLMNRAIVTIELFKLDNIHNYERKMLIKQRAFLISYLYPKLVELSNNPKSSKKKECENFIKSFTADGAEHANCIRSFVTLFKHDKAEAENISQECMKYLCSKSH